MKISLQPLATPDFFSAVILPPNRDFPFSHASGPEESGHFWKKTTGKAWLCLLEQSWLWRPLGPGIRLQEGGFRVNLRNSGFWILQCFWEQWEIFLLDTGSNSSPLVMGVGRERESESCLAPRDRLELSGEIAPESFPVQ